MPDNAALIGCTVALSATLPQAAVLAASFLQFHPGARFAILLLDNGEQPIVPPNTSLLRLRDLAFLNGEQGRWPMLYTVEELTSVVKPVLFRHLLSTGGQVVVYFEHSTVLYDSLSKSELPDVTRPVLVSPAVKNDWGDAGRTFIAMSADADASLTTLLRHVLETTGFDSPERSFDDIPHQVVSSPGFAAAYWNLDPQNFVASDNGYHVAGHRLRCFDFRGYDPKKPHLLTRYQGLEPRILLSEHPAIAQLCDEYRAKLAEADGLIPRSARELHVLPSGLRIDPRMFRIYRQALQQWRSGKEPEPPSPFGPDGEEGFLSWLNEPREPRQPLVTRYMLGVWEDRPDVREVFPDPLGAHAAPFRDWYRQYGCHELNLPEAVVPAESGNIAPSAADTEPARAPAPAVNIAGYFRAELGIGVAARALLSALEAAGVSFNTILFDATASRQSHPFTEHAVGDGKADINIVCVNPDQLALFAERTGPELRHGRYTIGVWFWEVEDFPPEFHGAFGYVDEVWVASEFIRQTFLKVSPKPVFKFTLPVLPPQTDPSISRRQLGLPDQFIFLFNFDFLSVLERKNPLGLINAFCRAFPANEGPRLVIKTINGDKRVLEMEKLKYAIRNRPDIVLMDGYLPAVETATLTALADCYVSLHRSEGFGLTIAEAMALGKPVIATAYSGNLEFMTEQNSYLCPSSRVPVGWEREPYPAESYWSEPDLAAAADLLRHVYCHREEARARGARAASDLRSSHSPAVAGKLISDRLATIRRRRASPGLRPSLSRLEDRIDELQEENAKLRSQLSA